MHVVALLHCETVCKHAVALQAADDVEAGRASNLEAALTSHYTTLQATFLASALHQLTGTDFDLLAFVSPPMWQAAAEVDGEAGLAQALLSCLETRTVPELLRLQGLSWTLCCHRLAGPSAKSRCPCFAAISAAVNAAKVSNMHNNLCIPVPSWASPAKTPYFALFSTTGCSCVDLCCESFLACCQTWRTSKCYSIPIAAILIVLTDHAYCRLPVFRQ